MAEVNAKAMGLRVVARRQDLGLSQTQLAERVGMKQQGIVSIEGGGVKRPRLIKEIASVLQTSQDWLLFGTGPEVISDVVEDDVGFGVVPVVGEIAAGGRIDVDSEQFSEAEPLFEIRVPFQVPSDAVALRINGDSMWPRYDPGDVIICYRYSQDPAPLVGFEAAVGTPDGNRYLKRLIKGTEEGLYNLESHNAAVIRDVQIAWVSEVFGVVRAARWQRLDDKGKRREMKRAVA